MLVFILCFSFYWLLRVIYFIVYLIASWGRFRHDVMRDWFAELKQEHAVSWERIFHVVFLPTTHESIEVLRSTLNGLRRCAYRHDRMLIVLTGEELYADGFRERARQIVEEFGEVFEILINIHPQNLPDEIPGKGSNLHHAGRAAVRRIDELGISYEDVLVSAFDSDTVVHTQYFGCLTKTFLEHPDRLHTSYQPVALYNNNMWESPSFMRVSAFGTTFWLLTELMRPDRLFTFSSHSMPLPALIDVGFWEKDIVTEDSRIFLQCFIRYSGEYTVTPLFIPVSMYTAKAETLLRSIVNLYKQQRRWMWGVEHFPYMLWHFFSGNGRNIPLWKKLKYLWNLGEGMFSMATAPMMLFVFSRLPLAVMRWKHLDGTVLAQSAPFVLEWLLGVAMLGIFASAGFALTLIPKRPQHYHPASMIVQVLQWILLPVTLVFFGALPAVEAQTRLMFGRYLGFYVAKKKS
ncbi:MAG: glycosyltransferase family 2 protein [Candidatus Uhrbacteria bacterium]